MKRFLSLLLFLLPFHLAFTQVTLDADGPGDTYALITSVLAPGDNPIETPDCSHNAFPEHIDEVFDTDLNTNVFRFHIHTLPDNDRCINFDRQRNEIKTYSPSPDNLLGIEGETVVYKWKFKLDSEFQSSPNFTHIHQLKSVGGDLASMPMYTLTTRKGNPDKLQLRYAVTDSQITSAETPLAPFLGTWLSVTETITYGFTGTYDLEIKRVADDQILFAHTDDNIVNWRVGAEFVRPKWGIYRSIENIADLRDEMVLFANFSIEEIDPLAVDDTKINAPSFVVFQNPVENTLHLKNIDSDIQTLQLYSLTGQEMIAQKTNGTTAIDVLVSDIPTGTYLVVLSGERLRQSQLVVIVD